MPKFDIMHQPTDAERAAIERRREIARRRPAAGMDQVVPMRVPDPSDLGATVAPSASKKGDVTKTEYRHYTEMRCWTESDDAGWPKYRGERCDAVVARPEWSAHLVSAHPHHLSTQANFHPLCPTCGQEAAQGGMRIADRARVYCCREVGNETNGHWFD
jgi:hypothetical protein